MSVIYSVPRWRILEDVIDNTLWYFPQYQDFDYTWEYFREDDILCFNTLEDAKEFLALLIRHPL